MVNTTYNSIILQHGTKYKQKPKKKTQICSCIRQIITFYCWSAKKHKTWLFATIFSISQYWKYYLPSMLTSRLVIIYIAWIADIDGNIL